MRQFAEQVAIITGAASGIGRATALEMAASGARVVVADINEPAAQHVVEELRRIGPGGLAATADVANEAQVRVLIERAAAEFGRIDILVNNAADVQMARIDMDVIDTDLSIWDRTYEVILRGAAATCKYAIPHMLKQGKGAIVNVSSVSGLNGDVRRHAYGAIKAGLNSLTKSIATTFGKRGVRCNAVCPGTVAIRPWPETYRRVMQDNVLTPDVGKPEALARVIAFLASDEASFITGEIVIADGGLMAHMPWHAQFEAQDNPALR